MLRGNAPATIDGKGRLKIPTSFRRTIEESHGRDFFITSLNGEGVRLYPFPVWEKIEAKIASFPSFEPAVEHLLERISYYGAMASMDAQGRVLIQAHLRESAEMVERVAVLGKQDHLEVWNDDRIRERMQTHPLTEEDRRILSGFGL